MKKIIKYLLVLILLFPIVLFLLARFTNFSIHVGGKVWLNYDEKNHSFIVFGGPKSEYYKLGGIDGPYIIDDSIITVNENNVINKALLKDNIIEVEVNNESKDIFRVELTDRFPNPPSQYSLPEKMIVISDIEGNFEAFSGFLINNKVIDSDFNWIFKDGHLVLVGDFVDRGNNVIPVLWLIYKLEQEAEKHKGKVHFILGNHEVMNFQGNFKYAQDRYKKLANKLGKGVNNKENYKRLFSNTSHLGNWLRSKNIIEKIGPYIFVHAGLSPKILDQKLSIQDMNSIARENFDNPLYHKPGGNIKANIIMGKFGPFWYRGLAMDYKYYDKIKESELDDILEYYNSKSIVIGHTVVKEVSKDFDGKVINIDVKHGKTKFSPKTEGLLFLEKEFKIINGLVEMKNL